MTGSAANTTGGASGSPPAADQAGASPLGRQLECGIMKNSCSHL